MANGFEFGTDDGDVVLNALLTVEHLRVLLEVVKLLLVQAEMREAGEGVDAGD